MCYWYTPEFLSLFQPCAVTYTGYTFIYYSWLNIWQIYPWLVSNACFIYLVEPGSSFSKSCVNIFVTLTFSFFCTFSLQGPQEVLAQSVLAEVPGQLSSFFSIMSLRPPQGDTPLTRTSASAPPTDVLWGPTLLSVYQLQRPRHLFCPGVCVSFPLNCISHDQNSSMGVMVMICKYSLTV